MGMLLTEMKVDIELKNGHTLTFSLNYPENLVRLGDALGRIRHYPMIEDELRKAWEKKQMMRFTIVTECAGRDVSENEFLIDFKEVAALRMEKKYDTVADPPNHHPREPYLHISR